MKCPTCEVDLVMSERQGIEIDYCPKCRGVWLDRGELDKIIERSANFEAREAPPPVAQGMYGTPPHHRRPHDDGDHYRKKKKHWLGEIFD